MQGDQQGAAIAVPGRAQLSQRKSWEIAVKQDSPWEGICCRDASVLGDSMASAGICPLDGHAAVILHALRYTEAGAR